MIDRNKYILAKANGIEDRFRGDEISHRIAKEYPMSAQIALLMDRDSKPTEYAAYQELRRKVKDEVDADIAEIEKTIPIEGETI